MDRVPPTRKPQHVLSALGAMAAALFTPAHLPKKKQEGKHAEKKRRMRGETLAIPVRPRKPSGLEADARFLQVQNILDNHERPGSRRLCVNIKKLRRHVRQERQREAAQADRRQAA